MNVDDAMLELGLLLGRENLRLNDQGICTLEFDGRLRVDFEAVQGGKALHLSSIVSLLDLTDDAILHRLLCGNFLGVATGGAHFSCGPDNEILFEHQINSAAMNFSSFVAEVERFVNHLDGWEDRLAGDDADESGLGPISVGSAFHIRV